MLAKFLDHEADRRLVVPGGERDGDLGVADRLDPDRRAEAPTVEKDEQVDEPERNAKRDRDAAVPYQPLRKRIELFVQAEQIARNDHRHADEVHRNAEAKEQHTVKSAAARTAAARRASGRRRRGPGGTCACGLLSSIVFLLPDCRKWPAVSSEASIARSEPSNSTKMPTGRPNNGHFSIYPFLVKRSRLQCPPRE